MYKKTRCTCRVVVLLTKTIAFLPYMTLPSKQQRQQRLQKRLKKKISHVYKLYRFNFISFNSTNNGEFSRIEYWRTVSKFRKRKRNCRFVFTSSTIRENRSFTLCATMRCVQRCVVCNDALCATMTKKCTKLQSCCFANLNLLFCHSPCRRCRRCLSSLILNVERAGQLEKFVPC